MTRRFWLGTMGGCYVGHGETYKHPDDVLWWSKGGVLHGESPARIAFLKGIMAQAPPFEEMTPAPGPRLGVLALAKAGVQHLYYFTEPGEITVDLPGAQEYKVDGIDTWAMTVVPLGSAGPGPARLAAPTGDYLVRLSAYGTGERHRPQAVAFAEPAEGIVPLGGRFRAEGDLKCEWSFGDGGRSAEAAPEHVYQAPGVYRASLTVTDEAGLSSTTFLPVIVDNPSTGPLVRVGFPEGDVPATTAQGPIEHGADGAYDFGAGEPWKWLTVGEAPLLELEGLRSFTILGWARPSSLEVGSGGNRIAFNLNYNRAGFDLVHLADGRLRLAVNEWPDGVSNHSSPGKLAVGRWTFFAVTYDSGLDRDNVCWYFGDADTPATLDRKTTYAAGATGQGSGPLTVGNYNTTLHSAGLDRQFRGQLRAIQVFGSRLQDRGALQLEAIRGCQQDTQGGR
jgi:PKD repeat protein